MRALILSAQVSAFSFYSIDVLDTSGGVLLGRGLGEVNKAAGMFLENWLTKARMSPSTLAAATAKSRQKGLSPSS